MAASRLGIFGGTFDPPHLGHLLVAVHAHRLLRLDRVWWVVANDPWQKRDSRKVSPAAARVEMVRAVVDGRQDHEVCAVEIERGGPSYTFDTVTAVLEAEPDVRPVLILGWDAAASLPTWHRAAELVDLVDVAVVPRGGEHVELPEGWCFEVLDSVPTIELSSSDLRSRFTDGRPLDLLVDEAVISVARRHGLYGVER